MKKNLYEYKVDDNTEKPSSLIFINRMLFNAFILYLENSLVTDTKQHAKYSSNPISEHAEDHSPSHTHETDFAYQLSVQDVKEMTIHFKKYIWLDTILQKFFLETTYNYDYDSKQEKIRCAERGENHYKITRATHINIPESIIKELQALPSRVKIAQEIEETILTTVNLYIHDHTGPILAITVIILDYNLNNLRDIATQSKKYPVEAINTAFDTLSVYTLFSKTNREEQAISAIKDKLTNFSKSGKASRGKWESCEKNKNYEMGVGSLSGQPALADISYHIELISNSNSIKILDKNNKYLPLDGHQLQAVALKFATDLGLLLTPIKTEQAFKLK